MNGMHGNPNCNNCGAELPASAPMGLCVPCLFSLGLDTSGDTGPITTPLHGSARFGEYELLDTGVEGGMGKVYRARHANLNRVVALKVIRAGTIASPRDMQRFRTEAEATASLDHPHIVPIYDVGNCDGRYFFTMKWYECGSLADALRGDPSSLGRRQREESVGVAKPGGRQGGAREHSPFAPRRAAELVASVARAIHHAHQRGIIHRDLKPSNILLDPKGQPHISDFGLAKRIATSAMEAQSTELTQSGDTLGTPAYMAPEQASGNAKQVTTSADVYALGAILYELICGRPPFVGDTPLETLRKVVDELPKRPSALLGVDPSLEIICLKCLEKEAHRRYPSAEAVADDLERWLRGEPVLAKTASVKERAWRLAKRHPTVTSLSAALTLVLLGAFATVTIQLHRVAEIAEGNRKSLYAADVSLAEQSLLNHDPGRARRLLSVHIPGPNQSDLRGFEWRYLWDRAQGDQTQVLAISSNVISTMASSPDGKLFAVGDEGGIVRMFQLDAWKEHLTLTDNAGSISSISFSYDGGSFAYADTNSIKIVHLPGREISKTLPENSAMIAFSPTSNLLAIAVGTQKFRSDVGFVKLVDPSTGAEVGRFDNSGGRLRFSPDGELLAIGTRNGRISLWNLASGREVRRFYAGDAVMSLAFSRDRSLLAVGRGQEFSPALLVFGVTNGLLVASNDVRSQVWSCAFNQDGTQLSLATSDPVLRLWDFAQNDTNILLAGHSRAIRCVMYSPDAMGILSGGEDGTVRIWEPKKPLFQVQVQNVYAFSRRGLPSLSPDGRLLLGRNLQSDTFVLNLQTLQPILLGGKGIPIGFPNADCVIVQQRDAKQLCFLVWSLSNHVSTIQCLEGCEYSRVQSAAVSSSKSLFAVGQADGSLRLVDPLRWKVVSQLNSEETADTKSMAFSPDGTLLATAAEGIHLRIWEVPSLRLRNRVPAHRERITCVAFSSQGDLLATGGRDGLLKLWNVAAGELLHVLEGHTRDIADVAFSVDGRTVASVGADRTVRLWNLDTQREMLSYKMDGFPSYVAFAPAIDALIVAGDQMPMQIWKSPRSRVSTPSIR